MSGNRKPIRRQLMVNKEVQGAIIKRCIFQWFLCTSLIMLTVAITSTLRDPSKSALSALFEMWVSFSPAIVASFFLLPILIYDLMKASNRIAGPLYRLRNEMERLRNGDGVRAVRFRDGDYWQDLADEFNSLAAQVQKERKNRMLDAAEFEKKHGQFELPPISESKNNESCETVAPGIDRFSTQN